MKYKRILLIVILSFFSITIFPQQKSRCLKEYTLDLFDISRQRLVPVAIYLPEKGLNGNPVIIMNHGYDANKGGSYQTYSSITHELACRGYFVISIQHELPDDEMLAMEGNLYINRLPNWKRGVENIAFTIQEFKKIYPSLNWIDISLIGHSNGGDMIMLFATEYPGQINRAISLDHRRMPVPRTNQVKLYSLRGCDYEADEDVIPTEKEQDLYNIRVIKFDDIKHGDMDDKGSVSQHKKINKYILEFLKE